MMERRNHKFYVPVSKEELLKLKNTASSLGLPLSAYARLLLLNAEIKIFDVKEKVRKG